MEDIFRPEGSSRPKRVLIEGTPGRGKSIMCQRLAYHWAQGVEAASPKLSARTSAGTDAPVHASTGSHTGSRSTSPIGDHPLPTHTPPEPVSGARPSKRRLPEKDGLYQLADFALVLLLIVRNLVVGDLSDNLLALLVGKNWSYRQGQLRNCLATNCQQVLVVLDGYEEAKVPHRDILDQIIGDNWMKGCTVLVTSRPGFCKSPSDVTLDIECESSFDVTFDLEGFDLHQRERYINRYMEVVKRVPGHPCVAVLLHRLESPGIIGDLCSTPLFLVIVCVLSGQKDNALPGTSTELYEQFLSFLRRQAAKRHGFKPDDMSSLQQTLQCVAFALLKDNSHEISLATIEQHSATQSPTPGSTILSKLCQFGFLIQNYTLTGLDDVVSGSFIHQSFVDYFAAKHFVTISKDQRKKFIDDTTIFHYVFVHVAGLAAGCNELWGELFDGWWRGMTVLDVPRFDSTDQVSEMWTMHKLTRANHVLFHDAPFSWLAESTDVCSASHALLTHCKAICVTDECTESCVTGIKALCAELSANGLQATLARHPLYLGLYPGGQFGVEGVLDIVKQVGLTHGAVDCVVLSLGWSGDPAWTVSECASLAAEPGFTRLMVIELPLSEWSALDALSRGFMPSHPLQKLSVGCDDPTNRGVMNSQHLTEFRRNVRCLSNIRRIFLWDKRGHLIADAKRDLRDWGEGRGVVVFVMDPQH